MISNEILPQDTNLNIQPTNLKCLPYKYIGINMGEPSS